MFVPQSPTSYNKNVKTSNFNITEFYGADFSNAETNISTSRSPNPVNMIRSSPGKVRKRVGYYHVSTYTGKINGHYTLAGKDIIHAGTNLYCDGTVKSTSMNNETSVGVNFNDKVYILDGNEYWQVSYTESGGVLTFTVDKVSDHAYIPRIIISKNPDATGGYAFEDINLLSDGFTESFYVGSDFATETDFQLAYTDLSNTTVTAKTLNADGTYTDKVENTDFTVDRATGVVTFVTAPGVSPAEGTDNVFITAYKDFSSNRSRITKADVCITYGEYGSGARLFVTGCPDFKNRDFWSALNDPTYFSDLSYSVLGEDSTRIMGYSLIGSKLAAHKEHGNVFVRDGSIITQQDDEGNSIDVFAFKTGNVITGRGAIAKRSFVSTDNEPLFLTENGIFALTTSDVTGERYMQSRSFFVNPRLLAEDDIEETYGCVYKDFCLFCVNGHVYALDLIQRSTVRDEPYSNYQYEVFYLDNIPARVMWVDDGKLYFGDKDGNVCCFYADHEDNASYSDQLVSTKVPINASWETPEIDCGAFSYNKTFRYFASRLSAFTNSGFTFNVDFMYSGTWYNFICDSIRSAHFKWSGIKWSRFAWTNDTTTKMLGRRLNVKNVDKVKFKLHNSTLNEPFGFQDIFAEYILFDKYKG